jgi:hypothetical protein
LKLKGLLGLVDPLLGLMFNQIGDRAAAGLIEALAGERVLRDQSSECRSVQNTW